jgi:cytochrome c oxidase assembly factor CtaG
MTAPLLAASTGPTLDGWALDPALVWCALAAVLHVRGVRQLRRRFPRSPLVAPARVASFWAGIGVVVVAVASPLDRAADELFAFHMTQHLLISLVAPLLLVASTPLQVCSFGLSSASRRTLLRATHRASVATGLSRGATGVALAAVALHVLVMVAWHVPAVYDAAVRDDVLHGVEHLTMFLAGLLLWWVVLSVGWRARSGLAVVYLFLAGLPMGALAAMFTLAPHPLYTSHLATAASWGMSPLSDQQLAGAIMWVPGGGIYLTLGVVLFVRWLGSGPAPGEQVPAMRIPVERVAAWDG